MLLNPSGLSNLFTPINIALRLVRYASIFNYRPNHAIMRSVISQYMAEPKEQEVGINERFPLFDQNRVVVIPDPKTGIERFYSPLKLILAGFPVIPFRVDTKVRLKAPFMDVITPFDPKVAYQPDEEDVDLERRVEKVNKLPRVADLTSHPLVLSLCTWDKNTAAQFGIPYDWVDFDAARQLFMQHQLPPALSNLRLRLFFPTEVREGDHIYNTQTSYYSKITKSPGELEIREFYPSLLGPVATGRNNLKVALEDNFYLQVPSNIGKLFLIDGEFYYPNDLQASQIPEVFREAWGNQ